MPYPFRYVPGCAVEYRGPTNGAIGGRWVAVIRRGRDRSDQYRATVSFNEGPDAAAWAAVALYNVDRLADRPAEEKWEVLGAALSMDGCDRFTGPTRSARPAWPTCCPSLRPPPPCLS